MNQSFQRRDVLRVAAAGAAVLCGAARAQGWPTKPVTMIVPFPAGGGTDAFARPLSGQFTKVAGQTLVIDNRGGAGGTLGASIAAKAPADGYTLFMGAVHHAIAPSVYPKLDYDIEKDFVPLMLLANVPQVVVINPKRVQANTIQEFIALVKRNPGKFNYGSAGSGTSHHLAGELFKLQTGTFITHIPYRGAGPALSDLISGNVDLMFDGLGSSSQHIKSGRIKALMVAGAKRNPAFPDVPCAAEVGLPDYTVTTWYGLWAPKNTPAEAQARAVDDMKKALATDELKTIWAQNGSEIPTLTMAAYGGFVNSEIKRWATVVKASGAKLE
ncbi:tripartite-type tricarboxylate transporter receptor subunit TctC [Variovorax boronicumulans]|jgi:tripartite-type tricarboxylate transporter receptor subunit TctC|uniref:Tripartite-type tricarboxylate transporter receptor subunit TctC n=1 Tax=Variovorax boronicumulans TaxID=436515 RepID=A0AAW8D1N8_9BURK|nr:tripartite tricarboxylate transporter substrate binding protein [Variovorax boronicumulans]MDP9893898.1 tripartite-type tricarboxylate transporter receptor subunit TctC [Variovorax boronicumulans]MDP9993443.1 tripartite-type tricarboxylate transporter receptor subunit TctC [Variovorax boronicumulans]MDQ0004690.1 tripartite-type tricarboxylate transporter receptor subunit TctC [Variovorax boronicumulans]MDQ0039235.1 tripartite-type tricarboxylate transporter receptor subunit TctC [Variovorax 